VPTDAAHPSARWQKHIPVFYSTAPEESQDRPSPFLFALIAADLICGGFTGH